MFPFFWFKTTIASVLLVGAAFIYLPGYYALSYLPSNLGSARVLASYEDFGGATIYVFELEEIVSKRIRETGISYLQGDTKRRGFNYLFQGNPFSEWRRTPVSSDNYAKDAFFGPQGIKPEMIEQIRRGMNNASSYYMITRNREGVILVMPNEHLAAYIYDG